jgi:hypothetical protein
MFSVPSQRATRPRRPSTPVSARPGECLRIGAESCGQDGGASQDSSEVGPTADRRRDAGHPGGSDPALAGSTAFPSCPGPILTGRTPRSHSAAPARTHATTRSGRRAARSVSHHGRPSGGGEVGPHEHGVSVEVRRPVGPRASRTTPPPASPSPRHTRQSGHESDTVTTKIAAAWRATGDLLVPSGRRPRPDTLAG